MRPLTIHCEDEEFIVGRVEAGTFAAMPEIAVHVIQLLQQDLMLRDIQARLADEHGAEVDLEAFIDDLLELDFIESIDGRLLQSQPASPPHLPWIDASHVGWIFEWPGRLAFATLMACGLLTLALHPELLPRSQDFFWTATGSLVLAGNALWLAVNLILHELAHLIAARSLGLPARIELSTRLHFLVAQTQLSSLWSVPRRQRIRVYLAGIAWDLVPIALGLILSAYLPITPEFRRILAAAILVNWLGILWQFNIYLRTDIYYVILELVRGHNLYEDSLAYLAGLGRRLLRRIRTAGSTQWPLDAALDLPATKFRRVKIYAGLVFLGSVVSLTIFLTYSLPVLISATSQAIGSALLGARTHDPLVLLDGALSTAALLGGQVLFVIVFLRSRMAARPPAHSPDPAQPA